MKALTLIHAAALIAIASTPAHAYFINYYPVGLKEGTSTTLKTRETARTDTIFSQRALEAPSLASFGLSFPHPLQNRNSLIRNKNVGAKTPGTSSAATLTAPTNQQDSDLQKGSTESAAEIPQDDRFSRATAQNADDNDLWPIALSDVENLVTAGQGKPLVIGDKWVSNAGVDNRDIARSKNPYAPPVKATVSAAVPEPTSLGLVTLGLSALALSRRRAHRKTAE